MSIETIGMVLKNRYCVIEYLGHGGEGEVYLAKDMELGVLWAVKKIALSKKTEAKLLKKLDYYALPRIVDYVEMDENGYLIMDYIRGKSLGELLREGKQFSFQEVLKIGEEAANILLYLHMRKPAVFYGDLKPDNLILSENGKLYLVDFGSAVCGYSEGFRLCHGTKGYAAPELYNGLIDERSDIFSLGKLLIVLCGNKVKQYYLKYPKFLYIITKCCYDQPEKRWTDIQSVISELENLCSRKKPVLQVCIVGLFLLLFIISVSLLITGNENRYLFGEILAKVTESYYEESFINGDENTRTEICEYTGKKIKRMLRKFKNEEEQKRLFLLLALNEELKTDLNSARLYYEQALLYEDTSEAYVEYGLFLYRLGEYEESREVWKRYLKEKSRLEDTEKENPNFIIWKENLEKLEGK